MKVYRYGLVALLIMACLPLWAQQQEPRKVDVHGGFVTDSVKIGERTAFYLSTHYPTELTVLLPDSAFSFAPFEYEDRQYFPTQSRGGRSVDSVVYYLSTFEVDALQTLSLPAFVVNERDCTEVLSSGDTIRLMQLVRQMPDSVTAEKLPLRESTAFADVPGTFNYPLFLIIGSAVLVVLVVLALVFGKRIRRHFKIRRLLRHHEYGVGIGAVEALYGAARGSPLYQAHHTRDAGDGEGREPGPSPPRYRRGGLRPWHSRDGLAGESQDFCRPSF